MNKNWKNKKIILTSLMACVMLTTIGSTKSEISIEMPLAHTATYDVTTEPASSDAAADTATDSSVLKDEAILCSNYFSYGEGSVFVTIEKDGGATEDTLDEGTTDNIDDVDNLDEVVETPEATDSTEMTEGAEDTTEATQGSMNNTGIASSLNLIDACFSEDEKMAIQQGTHRELKIIFHQAQENELKKTDLTLLEDVLKDSKENKKELTFSNYTQILIKKKNLEDSKWENLTKLQGKVKISLDVNQDDQMIGNTFYLAALKDDTYELLEDTDSYMETITCEIDGSYTYAVCYEEEQEEPTVTEAPKKQENFFGQLLHDDLCVWHFFLVGIFVIGLTWILAIRSNKARGIVLLVVDLLCVVLALLGHCKWDWIVTIFAVVVLTALHVLKWKLSSKNI